MSDANRMVPGPWREIRLPTEEEVKKGSLYQMLQMLDTIVEPENALQSSEREVMKFRQEIRTKVLEILKIKSGLLAELRENKTSLERSESFFTTILEIRFKRMTEAINKLVSEIANNGQILGQILGWEAVKELIEEIQNLPYLDPKEDGDLINKLEAKLKQNSPEKSLINHTARCQLALISDGGNTLENFRRRVQAALERNNYEELKGLVEEISALKIMQVYPSRSSPFPSEREAWKLIFEYHLLKRVLYYQIILSSEGGNTLEQFKERVQAALERSDDKEQLEKKQLEDLVRELEGLVQEIFALKIMQVYPRPSSPLISEREAYELKVEYKRMIEMIEEAQRELRKLGPST